MPRWLLPCLTLALAGCASAPEGERTYLCSGGRLAMVSFGEKNTARVRFGSESFDLWRASSGSGARYTGARVVLHTKDDEALLSIDGTELGPCQEVKPKP